ncbi:MAG TPA: OmpA family protein [Myxococcales bacterium]|nr:OmpA family protein [Myxococcales bacterium]
MRRAILFTLLVFTAFRPALAQQTTFQGLALDRFTPAARGGDFFDLDSLDLRGKVSFAGGVTLDWADRPLIEYMPGNANAAVVGDQLYLHLGADIVLFDRVRFGFNLPLALQQSGNSVSLGSEQYAAPTGFAAGDLRLDGDVRLFGVRGDAATAAIGVSVYVPTGSPSQYTGDGSAAVDGHFLLAGSGTYWTYALRVGFLYRGNQDVLDGIPTGSLLEGGAAVGVRLLDGDLVIGPEIYGDTGVANGQSVFDYATTPLEAILGVHYRIGPVLLGLGGGPGLSQAFGTPAFRGLFSIDWAPLPPPPAPPDRDHDGIPDSADACPDTPGVANADPKLNGCPPPPPDRDHDGIPDAVDACPDVPGVASDDPKKNGCPKDTDNDGIPDSEDNCPTVPGPASNHGCPVKQKQLVILHKTKIEILQKVFFKTNKAAIQRRSFKLLNQVADILASHPDIEHLQVEGHTDDTGSPAHNEKLSQARAESVKAYLVKRGVSEDRLVARGFGQDRPIASNATSKGRAANRRVEFNIVGAGGDGGSALAPAPLQ